MTDATSQGADDAFVDSAPGVAASDDQEQHAQTTDQTAEDADLELDPDGENEDEAADDEAEIEYEGKTVRVPKALKDAFLRHEDYTRKTQAVAETKRQVETLAQQYAQSLQQREQALQQVETSSTELQKLHTDRGVLEAQLAGFDQLIEQAFQQGDHAQASQLQWQRNAVEKQRTALDTQIGDQTRQAADARKRLTEQSSAERQARHQQSFQALAADPQIQLTKAKFDAAAAHLERNFGISAQELFDAAGDDPKVYRVVNALVRAEERAAKAERELKALKKGDVATSGRPAATVRGASPAGKNPERMSTAEWMEWERARVAKKANQGVRGPRHALS